MLKSIFFMFKSKTKFLVLVFVFTISLFSQLIFYPKYDLDRSMWANQAFYFEVNDERQYDFLLAYGHPGGPIIIGTILINDLLPVKHDVPILNYIDALLLFSILINTIIISLICYLIYLLRKNLFFVLTTLLVLGFHRFYLDLTPTSQVASLLFVLQAFYSLYIYENRTSLKFKDLFIFSVLSGFIMATRVDVGFIGTLFFGIFLLPKISIRDFIYSIFLILGSFILFDPYMWYMPFQHIDDLVYKFIYHYEFFNHAELDISRIIDISNIVIISSLSFLFLYFCDKKRILLNIRFLFFVLAVSIISYSVFLTSQINAVRYFVPFILIWEVLFPFIILDLFAFSKNKIPNLFKDINVLYLKILLVLIILFVNFFILLI